MRVGINRSCDNACHVRPFYLVGPNSSYGYIQDKITYQSQIPNWFMIQFITINQEKKNNTPVMGLSAIPSSTQFTKIRIAFLFLFKKTKKRIAVYFANTPKRKQEKLEPTKVGKLSLYLIFSSSSKLKRVTAQNLYAFYMVIINLSIFPLTT